MAKDFAYGFYHSGEWRGMREYILKRDGYSCKRCGAPGTNVHHIVRLTPGNINDRAISLNPSNLELLCDKCHKDEHMKESHHETQQTKFLNEIKQDYCFDSEGNIVPPHLLEK